MNKSIIISGSGGQGVLSIGTILANIALLSNKFVTYCPCYGAQMRGGAVNCEINISDKELLCTQNEKVDYLIALNQTSLDTFAPKVKNNGLIITDLTLCEMKNPKAKQKYIFAPLTKEAIKIGDAKFANSCALGILLKLLNEFSMENVEKAYEKTLNNKKDLIQKNIEAYLFGFNYKTGENHFDY